MFSFLDPVRGITFASVVLKMFLAVLCGGVIGIEREHKRRPAGFRTHILVALGAAVTVMTGEYLVSAGFTTDPGRLGAQVVAGIGFLGAGTIIVTGRQQVKGMTTAAGLWASACMGLCIGAGFYMASLICCFLILVTVVLFSRLERMLLSHSRNVNIYVEYEDTDDISDIIEKIKSRHVRIFDVELTKATNSDTQYPNAIFSLQLPKRTSHAVVMTAIAEIDAVRSIEEL